MFQNLRTRTEREEEYKDMDLISSKRGFHRSPGTNSSVVKGNETRLIRCVNCGFPCDRERDPRSAEDSWVFLSINYGSQLTAGPSIGDSKYPVEVNTPATTDTNAISLLHFDTDFTDVSLSPLVYTARGGAVISSTRSKFGGASCSLPSASTSYVDTPFISSFNFTTGPFTFDFWINFVTISGNVILFGSGPGGAGQDWFLQLTSGGALRFFAETGVTVCDLTTANLSLSTNAWYHIAVVRSGSSFFIFLNGVSQSLTGTALGTTALPTASSTPFTIGAAGNHIQPVNAYIDEFRPSNIARWTANFTPSTSAYVITTPASTTYVERGPDLYYERTMSGGCPSCGSPIYDKKPQDVNLP